MLISLQVGAQVCAYIQGAKDMVSNNSKTISLPFILLHGVSCVVIGLTIGAEIILPEVKIHYILVLFNIKGKEIYYSLLMRYLHGSRI